jgi:hypothetical protein
MSQVLVEELPARQDYELSCVSIYEIRHADEEPEFLVTWDRRQLRTRKGVENAIVNALASVMDRPVSSECQVLGFRKDHAGQESSTLFMNAVAAGRRKHVWQYFTDSLARSYKEQKGTREGAVVFALFTTGRRTYSAVLRVAFEREALQLLREKRDLRLAGDVFLLENLRKCVIYPYRSKDTGKPDPNRVLVVQRDTWAHYFVEFLSLEWYPTAAALASEFSKVLSGKSVGLGELVRQMVPRIEQTYRRTGGATTKTMTFQIDNVSIRFTNADYENRKVLFRRFAGRIVGLVVGTRLRPKYGGATINVNAQPDETDDLNRLVLPI